MVDWNEFQRWALSKMSAKVASDRRELLLNGALGLTGEAGEFADMVKKVRHHGHLLTDEVRHKMLLELGDVLFYVATAAASLDATLELVVRGNVDKLERRYPSGFEVARSSDRTDEAHPLSASELLSTAPVSEPLRTDPPIKTANDNQPTIREIDEREFKHGYAMGKRPHRPWDQPSKWIGSAEVTRSADAEQETASGGSNVE